MANVNSEARTLDLEGPGIPAIPVLDEYRSVRDHLHGRLCREVEVLESRIRCLKDSSSPSSGTIIRTYERMIAQKKRFMSQWGMSS